MPKTPSPRIPKPEILRAARIGAGYVCQKGKRYVASERSKRAR